MSRCIVRTCVSTHDLCSAVATMCASYWNTIFATIRCHLSDFQICVLQTSNRCRPRIDAQCSRMLPSQPHVTRTECSRGADTVAKLNLQAPVCASRQSFTKSRNHSFLESYIVSSGWVDLGQAKPSGVQLLKVNMALAHMYPRQMLRASTNANCYPADQM